MKIALIGYGKMGRAIEEIALQKGHTIALKITSANLNDLTSENLQKCDAAIEFTNPESAVLNLKVCINAGVPVVCGTTGWIDKEEEVKHYCASHGGTLLYASNFSIGVNIFFEINKKLATLMAAQKEYEVVIKEVHHTQKKDTPSGTAISLARPIITERTDKDQWTLKDPGERDIQITSIRKDPAAGTHHVLYSSPIDDIEIIHTAHSRKGFAAGALLAAEFIAGKKGIYTMEDILKPR